MASVIDLYPWRNVSRPLSHPAGVSLPLEDPELADLLIPQVRHAIATGKYFSDLIRALPAAVRPGDRVLVVGSGLGVLSTLVAQAAGVEKVITMEPNVRVAAYIDEVHQMNGVPRIETLNAIPSTGGQRRVPLFVRHDVRMSSLVPDDGAWRQVMLVPGIDLGLVLAEERISLIVAERSMICPRVLAGAKAGSMARMLLGFHHAVEESDGDEELSVLVGAGALTVETYGAALVLAGDGAAHAGAAAGRAR